MQKPITKKLKQTNCDLIKTALWWAVLLLSIDRGFKVTALLTWSKQTISLVIPGWFLGYKLNQQIAFSLPWSGPSLLWSLVLINTILLVVAIINIKKRPDLSIGWFLLLAGSFSNLYDRIIYGGVIDYLANWWTFLNLADLLIFIGLLVLLVKQTKSS